MADAPPAVGVDPRLDPDLAAALEVATSAARGAGNLLRLARLDTPPAGAWAPTYDHLVALGQRKAAVDAVLADLVPAADPMQSFGAGCAHLAALALRDRVLTHARDACRGDPDQFRIVARGLTDWPDDGPIAAACEREAYRALNARCVRTLLHPPPLAEVRRATAPKLREFAHWLPALRSYEEAAYGRSPGPFPADRALGWLAREWGKLEFFLRGGDELPPPLPAAVPDVAALRNAALELEQHALAAADRFDRPPAGPDHPSAGATPAPPAGDRDGPEGGCWVRWMGTRHDVPKGNVYKLIDHFWARDAAGYDELYSAVFDGPVEPQTIRSNLSKVNAVLGRIGVSWRLEADSTARVARKTAP